MKALVIGARRARQGIGAFVAQALIDAGCELVGVVGTSPGTVREPAAFFDVPGYVEVSEALRTEQPDLVAICSPIGFHREQLELVANADCHCLCDKPLWWDDAHGSRAWFTDQLIENFEQNGKYLALLTQWPHALPAFYALHPDLAAHGIESFAMQLGPTTTGARAVLDSISHPLSMLERLVGLAEVKDVRADLPKLEFSYGGVAIEVTLTTTPEPPRPAAFAINGRWARRVVEPGYRLFLEDDGRRVPMKDPMPLRVAEVVNAARAGLPPDRDALVMGMANLERLMMAVE
jgi:hypothetical protein